MAERASAGAAGSVALTDGLGVALRDAVVITVAASAVGLLVNLVHPEAIPLVAEHEYEILVPCPEPGGAVGVIETCDPSLLEPGTFLVDARAAEAHAEWSFGDAMNLPYDYLDPTPPALIEELAGRIARSRARRVVVYGDGDTPDTGEQLAKEISAEGIKNVFFIRGGAPALLESTLPGGGP